MKSVAEMSHWTPKTAPESAQTGKKHPKKHFFQKKTPKNLHSPTNGSTFASLFGKISRLAQFGM